MVCQLWPLVVSLGVNNPPRIGFTLVKSRKNIRRREHRDCRCKIAGTGLHSVVGNALKCVPRIATK
jgi:hypothetical protein